MKKLLEKLGVFRPLTFIVDTVKIAQSKKGTRQMPEQAEKPLIQFTSSDQFGVEIEVNSFDKRDFKKNPIGGDEYPQGTEEIAGIITEATDTPVSITGWQENHNNESWIVKRDSSCGIEICSPVVSGWKGVSAVTSVVHALRSDKRISADNRCSFHLHFNVGKFTREQIQNCLAWWIKCEYVFINSQPGVRKVNKYCSLIGQSDAVHVDANLSEISLKDILVSKYYSLNAKYLCNGKRSTIEVRIGEAGLCLNPVAAKNWMRLIIHFFHVVKDVPVPKYDETTKNGGLSWILPSEMISIIKMDENYTLSKGLEQTRSWFLSRLYNHIDENVDSGIFDQKIKDKFKKDIEELLVRFGYEVGNTGKYLDVAPEESVPYLFGEENRH